MDHAAVVWEKIIVVLNGDFVNGISGLRARNINGRRGRIRHKDYRELIWHIAAFFLGFGVTPAKRKRQNQN